jgi:hypothetical protein
MDVPPQPELREERAVRKLRPTYLAYTALDPVMTAVRFWLRGKYMPSELRIILETGAAYTSCRVELHGVQTVHQDICHALLAACVAAHRKLREAQ